MMRLFVYGTLRAGEENNFLLAGSRCLGIARTLPRYDLVDLGDYPALTRGGATSVVGEIYEVSREIVARLDQLERHPVLYQRRVIGLLGGVRASAYLMAREMLLGRPVIVSGDWRRR